VPRTRADIIDDVRVGIAEYVKFRGRYGAPLTFQHALQSHREEIAAALRDCPNDDDLRERLGLLDELCAQEGVSP
jgi:hypothetical protein